jgi:PmbA protein
MEGCTVDKLLKLAMEKADQAEVLFIEKNAIPVNSYNCRCMDVIEMDTREVCLRVIKNGRIGMATGSFTDDNTYLVDNALRSASFGAAVDFAFPAEAPQETVEIYDERLAALTAEEMTADVADVIKRIKTRTDEMMVNLYFERVVKKMSVLNSAGLDVSYRQTLFTGCLLHMFEGSKEGINKEIVECRYFRFPDEKIDELVKEYNETLTNISVPTGKMPVIFRPSSTWSIVFRLLVGANGDNILQGTSPLREKMNQQIFPELLTLTDDPTRPWAPGSVPFDDEGVPTTKKHIVEKGILKNYIFNLAAGDKYGNGSTGNAFKKTTWDTGVEYPPAIYFTNLVMEPGDMAYEDMVAEIDHGVVITDVIGFHSGNMLLGEFSMNVGIGSVVKNGKFVGRAMDTMVAGNVYEDFFNIKALGKTIEYNPWVYSPDMFFSELSVSGTA